MKSFEKVKPNGEERDLTIDNNLPDNPKTGPVKIFTWESAWIKKIDPENSDDIERIKRIDNQPEVEEYMAGPDITREDLAEENFYGICLEKSSERTEGFVWLYESEKDRLDNLKEHNLIDFSEDKEFLEISFARLIDPNLPLEEQVRGLVPSAVRQICFSILRKQTKTTIIAFENPQNLLSEGILRNAGFVLRGKAPYHREAEEEDNFWILDKDELEKILKKKRAKYNSKS